MRVLVGLSGGIDSSVAAFLLKEAGYEVVGVTMSIWKEGNPLSDILKENACFGPNEKQDIAEARRISEILDIEYHVLDCAKEYEKIVLSDFKNEYMAGRTPNPCIWCNGLIKFKALPEIAKEKNIAFDKYATGHYAQVEKIGDFYHLKKAVDQHKDQTYFLYRLTQQQLSNLIFPLGKMNKEEVKKIAIEKNFFDESKQESQDFYGGDYSELLNVENQIGDIVDTSGKVVGKHNGYWNYTIGQRRGLKVASSRPLYVLSLNVENNQVIVGHQEETFNSTLSANKINWIGEVPKDKEIEVEAKIRSTSKVKTAILTIKDKDEVELKFAEAQKAVTPGQSVVFYSGESVLGGGVII